MSPGQKACWKHPLWNDSGTSQLHIGCPGGRLALESAADTPSWSGEIDTWPKASMSVQFKEGLALVIEREHLKENFLQFAANSGNGICKNVSWGICFANWLPYALYSNQNFSGPCLKYTQIKYDGLLLISPGDWFSIWIPSAWIIRMYCLMRDIWSN